MRMLLSQRSSKQSVSRVSNQFRVQQPSATGLGAMGGWPHWKALILRFPVEMYAGLPLVKACRGQSSLAAPSQSGLKALRGLQRQVVLERIERLVASTPTQPLRAPPAALDRLILGVRQERVRDLLGDGLRVAVQHERELLIGGLSVEGLAQNGHELLPIMASTLDRVLHTT